MSLTYRDVTVYRPFDDEVPEWLVGSDGNPDDVRIAKAPDGRIVGGYRLTYAREGCYRIVTLGVCKHCRGAGIGRWLLGHALGIVESRGGRVVEAEAPAGLLRAAGFVATPDGYEFALTPE